MIERDYKILAVEHSIVYLCRTCDATFQYVYDFTTPQIASHWLLRHRATHDVNDRPAA